MFRSVDGAGTIQEKSTCLGCLNHDGPIILWNTKAEAQKAAEAMNADAQRDGNPFGYQHWVQENRYYR